MYLQPCELNQHCERKNINKRKAALSVAINVDSESNYWASQVPNSSEQTGLDISIRPKADLGLGLVAN